MWNFYLNYAFGNLWWFETSGELQHGGGNIVINLGPRAIFSRFLEDLTIALKKFFLFLRFWVTGSLNVPFATLNSCEPPLAAPPV